MAREAISNNSIARAVYDPDQQAIRVTDGAVAAGEGAEASANETIPNSSTEIGSNAGSRKVGILIILQDDDDLYISVGVSPATSSHGKITKEDEGVFFPTNASVYGLSAAAGGSAISWWEL